MSDDHESALHEKPLEFLTSMADSGGYHDGQAILPEGDHYVAWCTCGEWHIETATSEEGLHAARVHTGSIPA